MLTDPTNYERKLDVSIYEPTAEMVTHNPAGRKYYVGDVVAYHGSHRCCWGIYVIRNITAAGQLHLEPSDAFLVDSPMLYHVNLTSVSPLHQ